MNRKNTNITLILLLLMVLLPSIGFNNVRAQLNLRRTGTGDQALEKRAASMASLGRIEEAVDLYLELLYKNPGNTNFYFRVTALMPGPENAPTVLQILEDILKTQSKNTHLSADKGRLLYILDRKQEALDDWNRLLQKNPTERFRYTTITNSMLQAGASSEAIQILQQGRANLNDPQAFAFDLARIYAVKQNFELASREYLSHLDQNPGMLDYISNELVKMLENEGSSEVISQSFDEVLKMPGSHSAIVLARAKVYLHEQRYDACASIVLASNLNTSMKDVFSIANDLAAEKAWAPAGDLYLFISANSKDKREIGEALLSLASSYEYRLQSREDYASLSGYFPGNEFLNLDVRILSGEDVSLDRTLKLYDSLQTLLPRTDEAFLASYHIAEIQLMVSGDVDRAIQGFQNIFENARIPATRLAAGKRLVDAWLVRGDTTAALESLNRLVEQLNIDEDDPQIVASRIKILIHKGDIPALKKELLNLSGAASPASPIFNDGLEFLALLDGNGEGDDPQLGQYLKGERLIGQHKLTEAIDALKQISGESNSIADEASVRVIQILLALHNFNEASENMDKFLLRFPDSEWRATVLIWRGEQFQFIQNAPSAAIPYYEEVIVNHPGYLGIQNLRLRLRSLLGAGS